MENREYQYLGAFVPASRLRALAGALQRRELARPIRFPHVTFVYRPETADERLFGTVIRVRAVGYGCDGENEGLKVELSADQGDLRALIAQIPLPHITLSVSKTGRPVNTGRLRFEEIEPFEFAAVFGGYSVRNGPVLSGGGNAD